MAIVHQSDISAWGRCPAAFGYKRAGWREPILSATAFGSVVHHALLVFERARAEGELHELAVRKAVETFIWYWNPLNIEAICEPVEIWLPRQGFSELRSRGITAIEKFAELVRFDDAELLGTEFGFMVPIDGTWDDELGEPHILAGSIDRLKAAMYRRYPVIGIDDYKTGKEYRYLRQNLQFTAYCYASTKKEFWTGWRGEDGFGEERGTQLYERFKGAARRGTWINMRQLKFQDAGWRGPDDYKRFALSVQQITASMQADIYPMTISGEVCTFCSFRDRCGGTGVPGDDHGKPGPAVPKTAAGQ